MKCELKCDVPTKCVDIFAEVGMLVQRPELGHLCRAARKAGTGITEELVSQALPGIEGAGARCIRDWCYTVRLCAGSDAHLTPQGREAANTDLVPMPEQGVFGMWLTRHELLGRRVLHLVRRFPGENDPRHQDLKPLVFRPDVNTTFTSAVDPARRFVVRDFPASKEGPMCRKYSDGTCTLRWTLDFDKAVNRWKLEGRLSGPGGTNTLRHGGHSVKLDMVQLRDRIAEEYLAGNGTWDREAGLLRIAYEDVETGEGEGELKTFRADFELESLEIPGCGTYREVDLEEVPIGPRTGKDAGRWAHALLRRNIRREGRFLSRAETRRMFHAGVEDTPLEPHGPDLQPHRELADSLEDQPDLWWRVVAPVDLSPFPFQPDELGERPYVAADRPARLPPLPRDPSISPTQSPGPCRPSSIT